MKVNLSEVSVVGVFKLGMFGPLENIGYPSGAKDHGKKREF